MEKKRIAIVTGASSGMGKEFVTQIAKRAAAAGSDNELAEIWILARRAELLEKLEKKLDSELTEKITIRSFPMDITKADTIQRLKELLATEMPHIMLLVNCAGYGIGGAFMQGGEQEETGMVRLNCEALTGMTYLCLPYMEKGSAVINISSSAAFLPQPDFAVYAASKAYVLNFSRALSEELREKGITVTAVCPGPVDTPFFQVSERHVKSKEYKKKFRVAPEAVVKQALLDMEKGKTVSVYGGSMKALRLAAKLLPHSVILAVMRKL